MKKRHRDKSKLYRIRERKIPNYTKETGLTHQNKFNQNGRKKNKHVNLYKWKKKDYINR